MVKIKLLSISKNEHRSEFSFQKEQKLFGIIRKFLLKLGFKKEHVVDFGRPWDEKTQEPILNKEDKIKDYKDITRNFSNEKYSLDIIFFSKEVNLIFNYKKDLQQQISKALEQFIKE